MPESKDPGDVWRNQPGEKLPVTLEQIVERRTGELFTSTRLEILMSIGAALLLVAVVAWRLRIAQDNLMEIACAGAIAWAGISLLAFRKRIWPQSPPRDAVAAPGLEFYRAELKQRRDHLRNEWLWHGPLVLAVLAFVAVFTGRVNVAFQSLQKVLPLLVLLAAWTAFGIWRRLGQAREIQHEIDEIAKLTPSGR